MKRWLYVLCLLLVAGACGKRNKAEVDPDSPPSGLSTEDRKYWITRLSQKFFRSGGISAGHELDQLLEKSDEEIVQSMLNDPRFVEGLFDFSSEYLGVSPTFPSRSSPVSTMLANFQKLHLARAISHNVLEGQDFLAALSPRIPLIRPAYDLVYIEDDNSNTSGIIVDPEQARIYRKTNLYDPVRADATAILDVLKRGEQGQLKDICVSVKAIELKTRYIGYPFGIFYPRQEQNKFRASISEVSGLCASSSGQNDPIEPQKRIIFQSFGESVFQLVAYWESWDTNRYFPQGIRDAVVLPTNSQENSSTDNSSHAERFLESWKYFWDLLPNSSTNANRKRAAYVLKRFFCDDLTPVDIVAPSEHVNIGKHGSEASCQSCHYKLDPLAGFFRLHNGFGEETTLSHTSIYFSDGASMPLKDYLTNWKMPSGAWSIGYIRSSQNPALNDYSDHPADPRLEDLLTIIQRSPEARACLVRRIHEYLVGDEQAVDSGFLHYLTEEYNRERTQAPGEAIKNVFKRVALSQAYQRRFTKTDECYDFAPGVQHNERPPCQIAFILEKNCVSCHKSSGASGGLDLSQWVATGADQKNFVHNSPTGEIRDRTYTMQVILDRLSTSNPDLRMPLNINMSDQERSALFLWVQQEAKR